MLTITHSDRAMSAPSTQQTLRRNHFTVESVRSDFIGDGHVVCKRSPTEIQMGNQVWCKQATKGFYWLMMPGMRTLHKKRNTNPDQGTYPLKVKSHGKAVAGLTEEQAFTPGPHDKMQLPEPVTPAHR